MNIGKVILHYNDNLYLLERSFREKEGFPIDEFKTHFGCETVLRRDGILYFCNIIKEAQVIEDEQIQLVEKEQEESTTPEEGSIEG